MPNDLIPARWQCFLAGLCTLHAAANYASDCFLPVYDMQGRPVTMVIGQEIPIPRPPGQPTDPVAADRLGGVS